MAVFFVCRHFYFPCIPDCVYYNLALILPAITLERKNAEQMPGIELIDGAVIEDGIDEFDNLSNEQLYGSYAYGSDQDPTSLSADEDS